MSHDEPRSGNETDQTSTDMIETIAAKYRHSINGYTLGELVKQYEQKRARESQRNLRIHGPYVPLQTRVKAFMERQIGARKYVEEVVITNIQTIDNELKIEHGNVRSRLEDEMTIFLDKNSIEELGLEEGLFDTDKQIRFIGPDPAKTLEERMEMGEIFERMIKPQDLPLFSDETGEEVTGVRQTTIPPAAPRRRTSDIRELKHGYVRDR